MSRGVNKVIIIGYLGLDPEAKQFSNGSQVVNIRVATKDIWKDKATGTRQTRTEWHKIALFGKAAEFAINYAKKGYQVFVEGSLKTNKWQGQDGKDRYSTEIVGSSFQILQSKNNEEGEPQLDSDASHNTQTTNYGFKGAPEEEDDLVPF